MPQTFQTCAWHQRRNKSAWLQALHHKQGSWGLESVEQQGQGCSAIVQQAIVQRRTPLHFGDGGHPETKSEGQLLAEPTCRRRHRPATAIHPNTDQPISLAGPRGGRSNHPNLPRLESTHSGSPAKTNADV
eukprot:CAMPEP_0204289420 /NCGR_PEP_ID=MMETSP0468-20130131/58600_1 /ASSEMBLY_ACC=CAM_ASM_000383 /TAXON_ID=2969 /ORGANISM="Oxyrrhis marina" /LENGTH=130 /DNA_ID=CAMNT_0051267575 /DNA_START=28 /DNA_END=417 /DNA_ORIENTATION=-